MVSTFVCQTRRHLGKKSSGKIKLITPAEVVGFKGSERIESLERLKEIKADKPEKPE